MRNLILAACTAAIFLPSTSRASLPLERDGELITKITYNPLHWDQNLVRHLMQDMGNASVTDQLILRHIKGEKYSA